MNEIERGAKLFQEGNEKLSNYYERAPYSGRSIHSTDYLAIIVRDYYMPAAALGFPMAMKECGDYFSKSNKGLAITYYKQYLKACPSDTTTKAILVAQFGLRLFM